MTEVNHNPDVLSCLANLSSDEVFTPPTIANQMLDLLPQDLFKNPNTKFLDPVCKSGIFLREIAKRLLKGLEKEIPDLQKRIDHIFKEQLFGIAITELTGLLSRRSIYCSKHANGKHSVSIFDTEEGNIRYRKTLHTWKDCRCIHCGASQKEYDRDDILETHAYEFIHKKPEEIFKMKFDVIIGNPPYQLSDGSGGSTDAAMPIYHKFIEQSIKLNPNYLIMIVPSKWMVGGRGLNKFREVMKNDRRIKNIVDYEDSSICFSGVHIDGGICYFLWDRKYDGETHYVFIPNDGTTIASKRFLNNNYSEYLIRDYRIISILDKIGNVKKFSEIVSSTKPFGVRKFLFNEPERYPSSNLSKEHFKDSVEIFGVKGLKGGAKRTSGFITKSTISSNQDSLSKYKLFFTTSYSTNATEPPEVIVAGKNTACTETFLMIGPFDTQEEQLNCKNYINTDFFKFLLYFGKGTMQVTKTVFSFVPLQDFSKPWTDAELYAKYKLTKEEIEFIESMVRPMEGANNG